MKLIRDDIKLIADPKRVILKFFYPRNYQRITNIVDRVLSLTDSNTEIILEDIVSRFNLRHKRFAENLKQNFKNIEILLSTRIETTEKRKLLIGAYFTSEYSIEAAALFNPSIVPHFDQNNVKEGELNFILSLRATGEGHISSIEFREGKLLKDAAIDVYKVSKFVESSTFNNDMIYTTKFLKSRLTKKSKNESELVKLLPNQFSMRNIKKQQIIPQKTSNISDLLNSNYDCQFSKDTNLSERVLFPVSYSESMGMEDARFVLFNNDNGDRCYYGTYTAYNGKKMRTQIIETEDFNNFRIRTLHGKSIVNKGFAIFPRKINGQYYITSRLDGENIFMMNSDNLFFWNNSSIVQIPEEPWEYVQLGNCGSPIETSEGWLLMTHAVGPMRRYVISAILLALDEPSKIIGRLKVPLLEPTEEEREGYVPNVVYSCGSIIHDDFLVIPYAMSDSACSFAKIDLNTLLNNMK